MADRYADIVAAARAVTEQVVHVERRERHAVIRLDDPGKRNVLSAALMLQLQDACEAQVADPGVASIVLTGSGQAFSAGGDLRMMQTFVDGSGDDEGAFMPHQWIRHRFGAVARLIAKSDTPFVAALNGSAAGVGLAFALTSDVVLASEDAVLVPAFGRLGLVPEVGTSWALTRALGYRGAFRAYVGGEQLDARRALDLGLVDEVLPPDELAAAANAWCERIAALPPHAVALAKPLLRGAADGTWDQALQMEELAEPICFTTAGFARGVRTVADAVRG